MYFIRIKQLVGNKHNKPIIPLSRSEIYRRVKLGTFPKPVKLSANVTAWRSTDIEAWIKNLSSD